MVITNAAREEGVTRSMANVLVTALDWDLLNDTSFTGGFWFKARDDVRAEVKPRSGTVHALVDRKLIRYGERGFPSQPMHLTPIGRLIALDLQKENA